MVQTGVVSESYPYLAHCKNLYCTLANAPECKCQIYIKPIYNTIALTSLKSYYKKLKDGIYNEIIH